MQRRQRRAFVSTRETGDKKHRGMRVITIRHYEITARRAAFVQGRLLSRNAPLSRFFLTPLLPPLSIRLSMPKARKYIQICAISPQYLSTLTHMLISARSSFVPFPFTLYYFPLPHFSRIKRTEHRFFIKNEPKNEKSLWSSY